MLQAGEAGVFRLGTADGASEGSIGRFGRGRIERWLCHCTGRPSDRIPEERPFESEYRLGVPAVCDQVMQDRGGAGVGFVERNFVRIAAEFGDVLLDPPKSELLQNEGSAPTLLILPE